jgi:glycosyltransferase involved in cell wall biosynthesis
MRSLGKSLGAPAMKFLYIGCHDVFSRHELGFIAALSSIANIDVIVLGSRPAARKLRIISDNGDYLLTFYELPCQKFTSFHRCAKIVKEVLRVEDYGIVFTTPRLPVLIVRSLQSLSQQAILRLWSIRAAKLRDNLRFGSYEDIFLFTPSALANSFYIFTSKYAIAVDHATYAFAMKAYPILASRVAKLYPPYGLIAEKSEDDLKRRVLEVIEAKDDYILGFTTLSKVGSYLKFEAKPHAIVLYLLARMTKLDVVLAGSTYDDWKRVFPAIEPPRNLHLIGRGFGDDVVTELYKRARLVVAPVTNRNISNRLLEALFYAKPIVTTEVAKYIHPELVSGSHIYISTWDNLVKDIVKLVKNDYILKALEEGARRAYCTFFSTKRNAKFIKRIL